MASVGCQPHVELQFRKTAGKRPAARRIFWFPPDLSAAFGGGQVGRETLELYEGIVFRGFHPRL